MVSREWMKRVQSAAIISISIISLVIAACSPCLTQHLAAAPNDKTFKLIVYNQEHTVEGTIGKPVKGVTVALYEIRLSRERDGYKSKRKSLADTPEKNPQETNKDGCVYFSDLEKWRTDYELEASYRGITQKVRINIGLSKGGVEGITTYHWTFYW